MLYIAANQAQLIQLCSEREIESKMQKICEVLAALSLLLGPAAAQHSLNTDKVRELVLAGLDQFGEAEQIYEEHRGQSRFVQYNALSQQLAADSRLVNTIKELTRESGVPEGQDGTAVDAAIAAARDAAVEAGSSAALRAGGRLGASCRDPDPDCDPTQPYRRIDGQCNNLNNPSWGAAGRILLRKLAATYQVPAGRGGKPPDVLAGRAGAAAGRAELQPARAAAGERQVTPRVPQPGQHQAGGPDSAPHRHTHVLALSIMHTRPCTALKFETNPLCSDCASCARTKY